MNEYTDGFRALVYAYISDLAPTPGPWRRSYERAVQDGEKALGPDRQCFSIDKRTFHASTAPHFPEDVPVQEEAQSS